MNLLYDLIEEYCEQHSSSVDSVKQALIAHTIAHHTGHHMLSGSFQGVLLEMISKSIRPRQILEIGTYTGFSAICLAEGLTDDGELWTVEIDDRMRDTHAQFLTDPRIRVLYGDVKELWPTIVATFDLIFIDAAKKDYESLLYLCLEKLNPGGSILVDNVLWKGRVLGEESPDKNTDVIRQFNEIVSKDERLQKILLPVRDGLYWIMKK
jgi:predicted O-methyltransferase YrrM